MILCVQVLLLDHFQISFDESLLIAGVHLQYLMWSKGELGFEINNAVFVMILVVHFSVTAVLRKYYSSAEWTTEHEMRAQKTCASRQGCISCIVV